MMAENNHAMGRYASMGKHLLGQLIEELHSDQAYKKLLRRTVLSLVAMAIALACNLGVWSPISQIVNQVGSVSFNVLLKPILLTVLILAMYNFATKVLDQQQTIATLILKMVKRRKANFALSQQSGYWHMQMGELDQMATKQGSDDAADAGMMTVVQLIPACLFVFALCFALWWVHWVLAVIAFSGLTIAIIGLYVAAPRLKRMMQENDADQYSLRVLESEYIQTLPLLYQFGRIPVFIERLNAKMDEVVQKETSRHLRWIAANYVIDGPAIGVRITVIVAAILLCWNGAITVGAMSVSFVWAMMFAQNLGQIQQVGLVIMKGVVSWERIQKTFYKEPSQAASVFRKLPEEPTGEIIFENVSATYTIPPHIVKERGLPPTIQALDNISFTIKHGECVDIVGEMGSGKSTILHLLGMTGLPYTGTIKVSGIDLREIDPKEYTDKLIKGMPQKTQVFPGPVLENTMLGNPDATEEQALQVLRMLQMNFDPRTTMVWGRGVGVSGGQEQRIGLARVFLGLTIPSVKILTFDEPTNNLDPARIKLVVNLLRELKGKYTILIVSHADDFKRIVDRTIYLEQGKIISDKPRQPDLGQKYLCQFNA